VSPFIFTFIVFGFFFVREKATRYRFGIPWAVLFSALFLIWPWSSRSALADAINGVRNSPFQKIERLRSAVADPAQLLPQELRGSDLQSANPLLPFPYEDDIPVILKRPIVAPVFQSHQASVSRLQQFYTREVERFGNDLEVIYATNADLDGVQSITRVPRIFEYLYRNFRLADSNKPGCGFCLLKRAAYPNAMNSQALPLQTTAMNDGWEIHPPKVRSCSLLKLNLELDYSLARFIGHTTPIDVHISHAGTPVLQTRIVPIEVNKPFLTYISLIPTNQFYTVFQRNGVPQIAWDTLRVEAPAADWAGVKPSAIRVGEIDCITF
jgi:hypothetical protein